MNYISIKLLYIIRERDVSWRYGCQHSVMDEIRGVRTRGAGGMTPEFWQLLRRGKTGGGGISWFHFSFLFFLYLFFNEEGQL